MNVTVSEVINALEYFSALTTCLLRHLFIYWSSLSHFEFSWWSECFFFFGENSFNVMWFCSSGHKQTDILFSKNQKKIVF